MIVNVINNDKTELVFGATHHITNFYCKFALPFSIDVSRFTIDKSKQYSVTIDILCFKFSVDLWRWK